MDVIYHYPPELFQLLVQTIPVLCRGKKDVLLFFRGAGVAFDVYRDLWQQVEDNRDSISKYEIAKTVLQRLNDKGEVTLRERREILKRVVEFEDFSSCWPDKQLMAKGLVSEVRRVIDVKDSFTRMKLEREQERQKRAEEQQERVAQVQAKQKALAELKKDLYPLFGEQGEIDKRKRGKLLEDILNRLFKIYGVSIRESFAIAGEENEGIVEQVDGVIELDDGIYLVEMKWMKDPADINHVSRHLVRIYGREGARGIFISASNFTSAAINTCREALKDKVIILCTLQELIRLIESEGDLHQFFKEKIRAAIIDKTPFKELYAN